MLWNLSRASSKNFALSSASFATSSSCRRGPHCFSRSCLRRSRSILMSLLVLERVDEAPGTETARHWLASSRGGGLGTGESREWW